MSFPYTVNLDYGAEKVVGTAKRFALGTRGVTPDGRVFYYALNGGTALEGGQIVSAPRMEATTAGALQGGTTVFVTAGSTQSTGGTTLTFVPTTNMSASQLVDGWLIAMTSPNRAMYKIKSQPSSGSTLTGTEITLYEQDKLLYPLTTAIRLALIANPYSSVIVNPAGQASVAVVGATPVAVPASRYFWCQTFGPSAVEYNAGQNTLVNGGLAFVADSSVAGAIMGAISGADLTDPLSTGATSEVQAISLPRLGFIHSFGGIDALTTFVFLTIRA